VPDWLRTAVGEPLPPLAVILSRIALAALAGFVVAGVYSLTLARKRDDARTLPTTLALLSILIALVTMVIGDNVARAFGLVGALSIVRFRTVVEDTRDTAFVIFAVAVGMAIGAGYAVLAAVGIPAVAAAALVMGFLDTPRPPAGKPVTITVRLGLGLDPVKLLEPILAEHLTDVRLVATGTARQGAVLEVTYSASLLRPTEAFALVTALNRVEGIQGAELRSTAG
jgi:hypothetical protein